MASETQPFTAAEDGVAGLKEVSNSVVRLYKDQFGRGPTSARSYWAGPDVLICLLENTLTPAERNLVSLGEHKLLRDTRMVFQYSTLREFCEPVERITGRIVRSFQSSIDTAVDGMAMEVFVLYPKGQEGVSRIQVELDGATAG
jgi:uncharacterized protein YbcI